MLSGTATNTTVSANTRSVTARTSVSRRPGEQQKRLAARSFSVKILERKNVPNGKHQHSLNFLKIHTSPLLKAIKDPGMVVIWYATFCMLAGFGVIFFMPHRQIWLSLEGEEEKVLTLAGSTTKNLASLEETCANIVKSLGDVLDREGTSSSIEL
jgi:cytochrome c biogenesis protein ResB